MLSLFKKHKYYIRLHVNKIEVLDIVEGISFTEISKHNYHNSRLLVAQFEIAEAFLRLSFSSNNFSLKNSSAIIQQVEMSEGGLSTIEKRVLQELFTSIGIKELYIEDSVKLLSQQELLNY